MEASKLYTDLPAAHRLWRHEKCGKVHGHNWSVSFNFSCTETDDNGFVVDFGKLGWLKSVVTDLFDHTILIAYDDPYFSQFLGLQEQGLINLRTLPDVSCEGMVNYLIQTVDERLKTEYDGRVFLTSVMVAEDSKNHVVRRLNHENHA